MSDELFTYLGALQPHKRSFAAGEHVFFVDELVRNVCFVQAGLIHLIRPQSHGATLVIQRAGPGAVLAEASLYSERYHCSARAVTAASVLLVARRKLLACLSTDAHLAKLWSESLALKLQSARTHIEIVSLKTVALRLDAWLDLHGPLPPKCEWIALASEIGVSPESLYRELARRRRNTD